MVEQGTDMGSSMHLPSPVPSPPRPWPQDPQQLHAGPQERADMLDRMRQLEGEHASQITALQSTNERLLQQSTEQQQQLHELRFQLRSMLHEMHVFSE